MPREPESRSRSVAIIGAGPLGRWLALHAARAGFRVLLEDVMPATLHHAQEYIRGQLGPIRHGLHALRKNPVSARLGVRARLQSCRKCNKMRMRL